MFGETPIGILILDFLLFVFGIITIPLLYKIFDALSKLYKQRKMQLVSLEKWLKPITK